MGEANDPTWGKRRVNAPSACQAVALRYGLEVLSKEMVELMPSREKIEAIARAPRRMRITKRRTSAECRF